MSFQKEYAGRPVIVKEPTYPTIPDRQALFKTAFLENGGSRDMNVDGSSTEQLFTWSPDPAEGEILLTRFQLVMVNLNIQDFFGFGNGPALSNGVLIDISLDTESSIWGNLTRNIDFTQLSTSHQDSEFSTKNNATQNGLQMDVTFDQPILVKSTLFSFNVTIRDNLTYLDYMQGNVFYSDI